MFSTCSRFGNYMFLICQFSICSSKKLCPKLLDFLRYSRITFASVDKRHDKKAMKKTFRWDDEIPDEYYVDLQDVFQQKHKRRIGMAAMAAQLIDDSYGTMKSNFKSEWHRRWEKNPLDEVNLEYAAKDAFVSHELYRIIYVVNTAQLHLEQPSMYCPGCKTCKASAPTEGSSSRSSKRICTGWEDSRKNIIPGWENWNKKPYEPKWPSEWDLIGLRRKKTPDGEWEKW